MFIGFADHRQANCNAGSLEEVEALFETWSARSLSVKLSSHRKEHQLVFALQRHGKSKGSK
ncbi:hypothetical protein A4A58_19595 [Tardiphaga robiniae]|uniref:Uncharacterized protein n=1 Tax=Tardiphaga robiniae TaxID=943830 RepID=A0A161QX53_9BRAD|nr:hypothetical protein A4A58_19595 [Tardiphaga robiniae]